MPLSALLLETSSAWEPTALHLSAVEPTSFVGPIPGACVSLEKWI